MIFPHFRLLEILKLNISNKNKVMETISFSVKSLFFFYSKVIVFDNLGEIEIKCINLEGDE